MEAPHSPLIFQAMRRILAFTLPIMAALAAAPARADPFASDWAPSLKSTARLVAGEGGWAGVEIRLNANSITYWRDPGDAGAPPTFDFSGSANLKAVQVHFPAPRRIAESDGGVAFGYDRDVLLPVALTPIDAAKPIRLKLAMTYAVCEKICLPARGDFGVNLPLGVSSPFTPAIAAAEALTPLRIGEGSVQVTPTAAAVSVCTREPLGADPALFIEGPEGWLARASADPGDAGCFRVKVVEKPEGLAGPVHARLTFVGAAGAYEAALDF